MVYEGRKYLIFQWELTDTLSAILLKYKVNFRIWLVDPRVASGRDRVCKTSVIRSEFVREPSLTALCFCFCTLRTNEIRRTDPLVQDDYARVVDLDIGASKSDICAIRVVTISERASRTRARLPPSRPRPPSMFSMPRPIRQIAACSGEGQGACEGVGAGDNGYASGKPRRELQSSTHKLPERSGNLHFPNRVPVAAYF